MVLATRSLAGPGAPRHRRPIVPKLDLESLQAWYRTAMRRRIAELEAFRSGVSLGNPDAQAGARLVGHALRGSGGTFGFAAVSEGGALLEDAPPESLARVLEGVIQILREIASPDAAVDVGAHAWLPATLGIPPAGARTLEEAWERAGEALHLTEDEVAGRLASAFGLSAPGPIAPETAALRLVPEALLRERGVLPLDEDGRTIRVATANPVDLVTEADIRRVSGRAPALLVVPPSRLRAALEGAAQRAPAAPLSPAKGTPEPARSPILVVDDDPGARLLARAVLERKGFPVLEAEGGHDALERFASHPGVSLAVVDLDMPGMGGKELVRHLRATPAAEHLAIVVLTGTHDPAVEADLIEAGADDYLEKPLDPRLFIARVTATLRRTGAGGA